MNEQNLWRASAGVPAGGMERWRERVALLGTTATSTKPSQINLLLPAGPFAQMPAEHLARGEQVGKGRPPALKPNQG